MQTLESIAESLNYGDLPETWRVPDPTRFSDKKTLYRYQTDALENAARALYLYYGYEHPWTAGESPAAHEFRKRQFAALYAGVDFPAPRKYETRADAKNQRENPVFRILSEYMTGESVESGGEEIPRHEFINRMCFWMATGSGKTLVMVKLMVYLHHLQQHQQIPPHRILLLAPSAHLLVQIRRTVEEFNATGGVRINLIPLRQSGRQTGQTQLGEGFDVYYHRSDNISDAQSHAISDYRVYENDGRWLVFLDEAHKGGKEDSKRQAYYKVLARAGFLFNFSATFTDTEDLVTTVKKYNLKEFVRDGYGKNICLNAAEFDAFRERGAEMSGVEKRRIVLKSLLTLAFAARRVALLRRETGMADLYHRPLMLTLVNSVNTEINDGNDLWAFFCVLRELASGEIAPTEFARIKDELFAEWRGETLFFGEQGGGVVGCDEGTENMQIADLREAVFNSRGKGALQFIRGNEKEIAFQMKNADEPFGLINIGNIRHWSNNLLTGFEETSRVAQTSFFAEIERSRINILMGSRAFFESWDTNRPNVLNFINIGGRDAKKFVVQSVGRGVRIETLPGQRRRLSRLPESEAKTKLQPFHQQVAPPETLFIFATNKASVETVLNGLRGEKSEDFQTLEGISPTPVSLVGDTPMRLLVPKYKPRPNRESNPAEFSLGAATLKRFSRYLGETSDALLTVRDRLTAGEIRAVRGMFAMPNKTIRQDSRKQYTKLAFLQTSVLGYCAAKPKIADGVREVEPAQDIVHFRHIRVHAKHAKSLQHEVDSVKQGGITDADKKRLAQQFADGEVREAGLLDALSGKNFAKYKDLEIKRIAAHYYLPLIVGEKTTTYIQHAIKEPSEAEFLRELEDWLGENSVNWDGWMFSKISESKDQIYIPYYDRANNTHRQFFPDFVFWMCRGDAYQIVFVDPKGSEHTAAMRKIDGYRKLFRENGGCREFSYAAFTVKVRLIMYNDPNLAPKEYRRFWTRDPASIFTPV